MKRTYKRKRKFNRTYAGTLTLRQKDINENRAIVLLVLGFVFMIGYAFMMTSNTFTVEAKVSEPIEEIVVEDVLNIPASPTVSVEQQIRNIAKEHNFKWTDYLIRLAKCENRTLNPKVINDKGNTPAGSIDRGIFQINDYWHSEISDECAYSVRCSTEFAIRMINDGRQHEWVCNKIVLNK
jgi:hypothetical protein